MIIRLCVPAALLLVSCSIWAATAPAQPAAVPSAAGSLFQVLLGLAVVLGLIAVSAWLLKRLSPGALSGAGGLRVVGGILVGPKERVVLVEFRDSWLLLGVTAGQITLLQSSDRPPEATSPVAAMPAAQFSDWMKQFLQKGRQPNHNQG